MKARLVPIATFPAETMHAFGSVRLAVRPDVVQAALPGLWFPKALPNYMVSIENPYWEGDAWGRRGEEVVVSERRTTVIGALRAAKRELLAAEPERLLVLGPQPFDDLTDAIRFLVSLKTPRPKEPALPLEPAR